MTALDDKNVQLLILLVVCVCLGVCVLALTVMLMRRNDRKAPSTITSTGSYCGHCGKRLNLDPERAVALERQSYFAYRCGSCRGETLLPTQSP